VRLHRNELRSVKRRQEGGKVSRLAGLCKNMLRARKAHKTERDSDTRRTMGDESIHVDVVRSRGERGRADGRECLEYKTGVNHPVQ
jgi:hypothetical protein